MKKRGSFVILRKFQSWFIWNYVFWNVIFLVVFAVGMYLWFKLVVVEVNTASGLMNPILVESLRKQMFWATVFSLTFIGAVLALAIIQAFSFSKRIAGPIFAINRHIEKCRDQRSLEPLKLRKNDLFKEIETNFNELSSSVKNS